MFRPFPNKHVLKVVYTPNKQEDGSLSQKDTKEAPAALLEEMCPRLASLLVGTPGCCHQD